MRKTKELLPDDKQSSEMNQENHGGGRKSRYILPVSRIMLMVTGLVAVCFLYTGSVYMSQFYRLIPFFDASTVDLITSCINYALQAIGILIFITGLRIKPLFFGNPMFFIGAITFGIPLMIMMQLSASPAVIVFVGAVFQLCIGIYSGCYLCLFAKEVSPKNAGLFYGIAYAFGSIGTYLFSLCSGGEFLVSKGIVCLYIFLALLTIFLLWFNRERLEYPKVQTPTSKAAFCKEYQPILHLILIVSVMMIISTLGSGLYYSLPQAENIDWNLIRTFYAIGLIAAGIVMDYRRWLGEVLTAASLIYPLIAFSLIGEGLNNTIALSFSYLFRGFLTVYYVISFTDLASSDNSRLYLAPLGLAVSRIIEALLTLILMLIPVPNIVQILLMAFFSVVLILLMVYKFKKLSPFSANALHENLEGMSVTSAPAIGTGPSDLLRQKALFAEQYHLTRREAEILDMLAEGLTDDEIAAKVYISRNTVRFHVSNILKKTETASRMEAVRAMQYYK